MPRRADADYIKQLSKSTPIVKSWVEYPLLILDKDTHVSDRAMEIRDGLSKTDKVFNKLIDDAIEYSPAPTFVFLDRSITIEAKARSGMPHNYYSVQVSNTGSISSINLLYPTTHDKLIWFIVYRNKGEKNYHARVLQAQGTEGEMWSVEDVDAGKYDYKGDLDEKKITQFMAAILIQTASTLRALGTGDKYAVETRGIQHRKVHKKKPWTRSDLATIIYLNKLPSEHTESKGGHHRSPEPHPRSGTWRRMDNERFRNHPKFGDHIWVKPSWVGKKETTVRSITYKLL